MHPGQRAYGDFDPPCQVEPLFCFFDNSFLSALSAASLANLIPPPYQIDLAM